MWSEKSVLDYTNDNAVMLTISIEFDNLKKRGSWWVHIVNYISKLSEIIWQLPCFFILYLMLFLLCVYMIGFQVACNFLNNLMQQLQILRHGSILHVCKFEKSKKIISIAWLLMLCLFANSGFHWSLGRLHLARETASLKKSVQM